MEKAIITASSNKFFPSLLNLLGSLKAEYPQHPPVFVYDLGLFPTFRIELERIAGVRVLPIPHFISFWRSCYTWKTYILANPPAELNLYLDAGCQVLKPLDEMFAIIDANDYLTVAQGVPLDSIVPAEYRSLFSVAPELYSETCVAAGVFGYKNVPRMRLLLDKVHQAGRVGLCLGFSPSEQWKNKGKNKTQFIRNCSLFRHDTTVLNLVLFEALGKLKRYDTEKFAGPYSAHDTPDQLIWNLRLNFTKLTYMDVFRPGLVSYTNRVFVKIFLLLKSINRLVKHAVS